MWWFLILLLSAVLGCREKQVFERSTYEQALASGKVFPEIIEFKDAFSKTRHFISYYSVPSMTPKWNSIAALQSRYVLTMQRDVAISDDGRSVLSFGRPSVYLNEVTSIEARPGYAPLIHYGSSKMLTDGEYRALLSRRVVRPEAQPVPGFDELWDSGKPL